jgi:5-formyltetrahydrofolate cyclo-ligase
MEPDVRTAKAELRGVLQRRLAAYDAELARRASARVAERALAVPEVAAAERIFTCLSFGAELDTTGLVERLLAGGREVYVPRADRVDGRLHVHRYPCPLETLSFGLCQPRPGTPEVPADEVDATLDVALVLGLAFDHRGYRLGYGRGYFDRFLRGRPFPAVGLAFALQLVDRLPAEPHDVPMAAVVTEEETVRSERSSTGAAY